MDSQGKKVFTFFQGGSRSVGLLFLFACIANALGGQAIVDDRMGSLGREQRVTLGAEWRFAQNAQLEIVELNAPGDLPVMGFKMTGRNPYPTFAGIFDTGSGNDTGGGTGQAIGDQNGNSLELSVDFRFEKETSPGAEMRIGLFNNRGSPAVGDNWPLYKDDVGYWISIPVIGGGGGQIFKELGSDGTIAGGTDKVLLKGGAPGKIILPLKDGWHTMTMTITRTSQGLMIAGKLDGSAIAGGLDTPEPEDKKDPPGLFTVFHEVGICTGPPKETQLYLRRVQLHRDGAPAAVEKKSVGAPGATDGGSGASKGFNWTMVAVGAGGVLAGVVSTWFFVRGRGAGQ